MRKAPILTLADISQIHAENQPNRIALSYAAKNVTYKQLDERSNQLANALIAEEIGPHTQIAFIDKNSENFFYILFGSAKANTSLVTVNFRLTSNEVAYILNDSQAELVFVGNEFLQTVIDCKPQLTHLRKIVVIDGDGDADLPAWISKQAIKRPDVIAEPTDRAVQMYTSGTTGYPKGVELSHAAMICAATEGLELWSAMYQPDAAVLATMPLFHIAAANLCLAGLYAGAKAVIVREVTPEQVVQIMSSQGITIVPLPAAVIHAITKLPNIKQIDLSRLDTLLVAGSSITVELLRTAQELLGCGFALSYGMTECCGGLTYLGPNECVPDAGKKLFSAGLPIGSSRIKIADGNGQELPTGEVGEIVCKSGRLMTGYWNQPEATAEAIRDSWYYSGDAGYLDDEGFLYVVDRIKDMVISGGENIYPAEIENELIKHSAVDDVAVIGIPDEKWGEALLACVILKQDKQVEGKELEEFLRSSLAGYKIPRRYEFVTSFPRNATGKVLKREMRNTWAAPSIK